MKTFDAAQFDKDTLTMTGVHETYLANDLPEAVRKLLYTRKLSNGSAKLGPSGQVVYSGQFGWSIVPVR